MMGSNSGVGGGGGGGGGIGPGMGGPGGPVAAGGDGRHDDEAVLTEFLSSLMDYTPTVRQPTPLCLLHLAWQMILERGINNVCMVGGATDSRRTCGTLPWPERLQLP